MPRHTAAEGAMVRQRLTNILSPIRDRHQGWTAGDLSRRILNSTAYYEVDYIKRMIGVLRHTELERIREASQNGTTYRPKMFLASLRTDERHWRYFNACDPHNFRDVMTIYQWRADGLNDVADTMGLV